MDIVSYFNNKGTPIYKGTIINGNGTVKIYDKNGSLIRTERYLNGLKQE